MYERTNENPGLGLTCLVDTSDSYWLTENLVAKYMLVSIFSHGLCRPQYYYLLFSRHFGSELTSKTMIMRLAHHEIHEDHKIHGICSTNQTNQFETFQIFDNG